MIQDASIWHALAVIRAFAGFAYLSKEMKGGNVVASVIIAVLLLQLNKWRVNDLADICYQKYKL